MLEQIKNDIKKRMEYYTDSRQPTGDEVTIAWLIGEIERLKDIVKYNTPLEPTTTEPKLNIK